jgi:hypothetical protein
VIYGELDVLKRVHRGKRKRSISRGTRRSRKTIKRYVETAEELGWVTGLHKPDEDQASEVMVALRPGSRGLSPGEAERILLEHKDRIDALLHPKLPGERDLRLRLMKAQRRRAGAC